MSRELDRRKFLKRYVFSSAGAALGLSLEEKALLAKTTEKTNASVPKNSVNGLPMGKIGNVKISRLICGGNLITGWAHSRDLLYTSELLKNYFTDEKIVETLQLSEENGVNTLIVHPDKNAISILKKYWKERAGQIQWLAQVFARAKDLTSSISKAIDNGAIGVFIEGSHADHWVQNGRVDVLAKAVEFIQKNGLIAGVAGHSLHVPIECEKAGVNPDYYMKTFHRDDYWSAHPKENRVEYQVDRKKFKDHNKYHDNIWCINPIETAEFMGKVEKPWIAYKVLAAGAVHPKDGFEYAFKNGADFIAVGMFDFQVREDVIIAKRILSKLSKAGRERPWRG